MWINAGAERLIFAFNFISSSIFFIGMLGCIFYMRKRHPHEVYAI
jgi:hypothetical protein